MSINRKTKPQKEDKAKEQSWALATQKKVVTLLSKSLIDYCQFEPIDLTIVMILVSVAKLSLMREKNVVLYSLKLNLQ